MRVDFRHGLVRYPTSNDQQVFLQKNEDYIRLSAANGETVATIAHKSANYLHTESHTVNQAWGPFTTNANVWLYIDIDRATGERTFGSTTLEPYTSPTAPESPQEGQHWFDLSNTIMKVYTNGVWVQKIRLVVAKFDGTSLISTASGIGSFTFAGSTVGLSVSNHSGRILFDGSGQPISNPNTGEFYTTENQFFANAALINNIRLESNIFYAKAKETIPKYHVVTINENKEMLLANYNQVDSSVVGLVTEDVQFGELGAVVLQGVVTNPNWNWTTTIGQKLWVKNTGQFTTIDPHSTDNVAYPEKQVPVARVLSPTQVIFEQGLGGVGPQGPPGSIKNLPRATTSDLGAVYLSTPAVDETLPIVASNTDPRLSDARPPEEHVHPADEVTFTPYGNLTAATVKEALRQLDDQKVPLSGGSLSGTIELNSDPDAPLEAATKRYVDNYVDQHVAGLRWLDPLELVNMVGHDLQTPPSNPNFGDIYFIPYGADGNWPKEGGGSIPVGHLAQYNATDWTDLGGVNQFPHSARFGVSVVSDTAASGPALSGHDDEILTVNFTEYEVIDLDVSTLQTYSYSGGADGILRKLDPDGNQLWSVTASNYQIYGVAVGDVGSYVYTAGTDYTVRKFDSDGNQQWSFTGFTNVVEDVVAGPNDNVYAAGWSGDVKKIDSTGSEVWNFGGHTDYIRHIAVDNNENVYSGSDDGTVRKLDTSGSELWQYALYSPSGLAVVDDGSYVYTADYYGNVHKIDSSGNKVWETLPSGVNIYPYELVIDDNQNIYIATGVSHQEYPVYKLDSGGNVLWTFTGHTSSVLGVAVVSGFVYSSSEDQTVRKIDRDGNELWSASYTTDLNDVAAFGTGTYLATESFIISGDQTSSFISGDTFYLTSDNSSPNVGGYKVDTVSINGDGNTKIAVVDDIEQDTSPYGMIYLWNVGSYYTPNDQDAVWVRNPLSLYAYNQYVYDGNLNEWIQFGGTQAIEAGEDLEFVGTTLNVLDYDQGGTVNAEALQGYTPSDFDSMYAGTNHTHEMSDITNFTTPYDIMFFAAGQMQDINMIVGSVILTRGVYVPKDGSHVAVCNTAPDSDVSYLLKHNGTQVGTIDFVASNTDGTVLMTEPIYGSTADVIQIFTPDPVEPNIEDVTITLVGCAELSSCVYSSGPDLFVHTVSQDNSAKKLDSSGNEVWTFYDDTISIGYDNAVDVNGNSYYGTGNGDIVKIDPSGNLLWSSYISSARVYAVAVDNNLNAFGGDHNGVVYKTDSTGSLLWQYAGHTDYIQDLTTDSNGYVYSASWDQTVLKIDSSGNQAWAFTGHTNGVNAVAVDGSGNVYTASADQTVKKLDSTGTQVWSYSGPGFFYSVAVDGNGNVIAGCSDNSVKKLNSNGTLLWSFAGHTDNVVGVAVDYKGAVYSSSWDNTVKKIDPDGNLVWTFTGHTDNVVDIDVVTFY